MRSAAIRKFDIQRFACIIEPPRIAFLVSDAMVRILLALFIAVPLRADIYNRLGELTHHLRSGGVPRDGIPAMTNPQSVTPEDAHYLADTDRVLGVVANGCSASLSASPRLEARSH